MSVESHILKRWSYICLLLIIQLTAGIMPSFASHRHLLLQEINVQAAREDYLEGLISRIPVQLEADDTEAPDVIHATKHRRKTRYYLSASSQQFSIATRVAYIDSNYISQSCYIQENKTGEYNGQKAFLPAYYTFLFRFTPF
ncbi:hypothetical protein [Chitinophaga solisilvae]|uniref:Uncharacterized protein n=1 Tax=Chitinophaga solisilvae TaxID=1233460 RepID=A0A3S1BMS1_9BACT|nr:hypothetical protein [Chitinophaga solisilvae]NSL90596.1 hypothetical protein [Chitinophaga solisilvae]